MEIALREEHALKVKYLCIYLRGNHVRVRRKFIDLPPLDKYTLSGWAIFAYL